MTSCPERNRQTSSAWNSRAPSYESCGRWFEFSSERAKIHWIHRETRRVPGKGDASHQPLRYTVSKDKGYPVQSHVTGL
jgi:hypothetical protein